MIALFLHQFEPDASKFGYEGEWLYPVSQLIDASYHERSFVQILLAIGLGPKIFLAFLWALVYGKSAVNGTLAIGLGRCLTHVLSTYISYSDCHEWHDMARIGYMLLSCMWYVCIIKYDVKGATNGESTKLRSRLFLAIIVLSVIMAHYFSQHRMYQVPGALSKDALCEWAIVFLDILFELSCARDFEHISVKISRRRHSLVEKV